MQSQCNRDDKVSFSTAGYRRLMAIVVAILLLLPVACSAVGEGLFNGFIYTETDDLVTITAYIGKEQDIVISGSINSKPVRIDHGAFEHNDTFRNVSIQRGVIEIGQNAFYSIQSLETVSIPDTITSIPDFAFGDCGNLSRITLPAAITTISVGAFESCLSLTGIELPKGLRSIESHAFGGSALISIEVPKMVQHVMKNSFSNCHDLTDVYFYGRTTDIAYQTFTGCSDSLVIHGYAGSTAEKFARDLGMSFELIAENPDDPPIPVTGVTLDKTMATISPGGRIKLIATVTPTDADDKRVSFSSGKPSVATVDKDGLVSAINEGEATITATTLDGGFSATCIVTVKQSSDEPADVTFTYGRNRVFVGKEYIPTVTFTPDGEYALNWKSNKPKIAKVDATGTLTPLKAGTVIITASTTNGLSCSRTLTVLANKITALKLDAAKTVRLKVGEKLTVNVMVEPQELIAIAHITAQSSKKKIADVIDTAFSAESNSFMVEAFKPGKAVITVKTGKVKKTLTIKVIE